MKMKAICFLPITLVLIVAVNPTSGLSCVGEDGKAVDWFIVYKLPKLEKSANQLIKTGYGYTYLTDRSLNDWTLSSRGINQKNSVFGQTLKPVLESVGSESRSKETISYLAYSDQSPGKINYQRFSNWYSIQTFLRIKELEWCPLKGFVRLRV